jgi:hypothetical protein
MTAPPTRRVVLALARVEGRRLVLHPLFLVGIALGVVMTVFAGTPEGDTHSVIEPIWPAGFPIGPLAVFGFMAANLAAMRDRMNGTEELFASAPLSPRARTAALLASAAWPRASAWRCWCRSSVASPSHTG